MFTGDFEFNFPRQTVDKGESKSNYSLADFISPNKDYIGSFAVTTGHGLEKIVKEFEDSNDDYNSIMAKVLADRLAEAFAEHLHERIRKEFWGYAKDENLNADGRDQYWSKNISPLIVESKTNFYRHAVPLSVFSKKLRLFYMASCNTRRFQDVFGNYPLLQCSLALSLSLL